MGGRVKTGAIADIGTDLDDFALAMIEAGGLGVEDHAFQGKSGSRPAVVTERGSSFFRMRYRPVSRSDLALWAIQRAQEIVTAEGAAFAMAALQSRQYLRPTQPPEGRRRQSED